MSVSLCFNEASIKKKKKEIDEDALLHNIVNHCAGLRHGTNGLCNNDTTTDRADYLAFACNVENDEFTGAMAEWIFRCFRNEAIGDTAAIFKTLKGYCSNDVEQFKDGIRDMSYAPYRRFHRWELCSKLATLALNNRKAEILEAILEVHGKERIEFPFHHAFDNLKHEGGDPELVRIVEKSKFESMVPSGKRFSDLHPLDYL